jgi:hypothetical protein
MNDKEVLKLALEALEHCKEVIIERGLGGNPEFAQKWGLTLPIERSEKAITAIKQALAAPMQEPVFELQESGWEIICDLDWIQTLPFGTKLYTTSPQNHV